MPEGEVFARGPVGPEGKHGAGGQMCRPRANMEPEGKCVDRGQKACSSGIGTQYGVIARVQI